MGVQRVLVIGLGRGLGQLLVGSRASLGLRCCASDRGEGRLSWWRGGLGLGSTSDGRGAGWGEGEGGWGRGQQVQRPGARQSRLVGAKVRNGLKATVGDTMNRVEEAWGKWCVPASLGSGCLAVWLSGCLAVSGCCLAEAGRLSGGWVAVWLGGWWLGGCGWWLAAAQGRGGTPWCYGSTRETP